MERLSTDVSWHRTSTAKYFVSKYRCATITGGIERAVAQVRAVIQPDAKSESYEVGLKRPDLEAIARHMGIQVELADKDQLFLASAKLLPTHNGFTVLLKRDLRADLKHFGLAHEIGHTLFFDCDWCPPRHMIGILSIYEIEAEENICNMFANALLIHQNLHP